MDSQSEKAEREESRLQFNKQLFKTYLALDHWHRFRLRLFLEGILVGIAGGLLIALFRFLLGLADTYRRRLFQEIIIPSFGISDFLPLLGWLAALFFIGGALYGMCRYTPMASGSGIPQVKGVILGFFKMKWFRILWVKITAGALGIGAGLSLGREGPSIQIGAVAAQGLSRLMGRTRMEERYLITSGASAGLAAAFNLPWRERCSRWRSSTAIFRALSFSLQWLPLFPPPLCPSSFSDRRQVFPFLFLSICRRNTCGV